MSKRFVLCLTAADRPGILAAVATALAELGGDIAEINHAVVKNYFAIILAADFPEERKPQVIVGHLEGVCRPFGVELILKDPERELHGGTISGNTARYVLSISGHDAPGIVARITGCLAREGIDITHLRGTRRDGSRSFELVFELAVPVGVEGAALQREVEQVAASLGVSVRLERATNDIASGTL
jgi:glycine cleavage system transcriptional repressor